ncbi:MAG TPA: DEAD/DEAH box helicase [Candidatus Micrarchaeia archaeon]|nr:DEAD/DEAH box helicase [Candidatus Micrarchaeia archaeon]
MTTFAALGVRPPHLDRLAGMGIATATPVQVAAIPPLLAGRDCVIQSPTGSGKTLAYLLPLVSRLGGHRPGRPRGLVLAPTRELATQIGGVLGRLGTPLRHTLVFGGVGYAGQISGLRSADVVIACPGRLLDLCTGGSAALGSVEVLVLDEADEMLDAGFARDVEKLIAITSRRTSSVPRQTLLASATMPAWVAEMARSHLHDPARVVVEPTRAPDLEHGLVAVRRDERTAMLSQLLARSSSTIVFHRTKHGAKKLARDLSARGHRTAELQGNLSQAARDRAIAAFRGRQASVLVATNVAARGIDVEQVTLVVNYELPDTADWLTHRVGRTARNGASGRALTFLTEDDGERWQKLRRLGAPDLQLVDADHLVLTGTMRFMPGAPRVAVSSRVAAPAGRGPAGGARGGPGRPRPSLPGAARRRRGGGRPSSATL